MSAVDLVEVGPRDGYQGIGPFIPTSVKIDFIERLVGAGLKRIEIGSFVSAKALPQLADTGAVLAACARFPALAPQVLVPSERRGHEAVAAGARRLVFVISVSDAHNQNNVRRTPAQSASEYEALVHALPQGIDMRLDLATAFDCPFEGRVAAAEALDLLERLVAAKPDAEICLCDTTGRADPAHVAGLFDAALTRMPRAKRWALHAHDTYGLGLANVHAAYRAGVAVFDASFAGLGGCPFAPGATGNVATEDLVWMFERMGVATGIDLDSLVAVAMDGARLPGGVAGGRVRAAYAAKTSACGPMMT